MAARRLKDEPTPPRRPPATTPEGREKQLIGLAIDEAEKQIRAGTASSQVLTHFLKLGSTQYQAEMEHAALQRELLKKKTAQLEQGDKLERLMTDALDAIRGYQGRPSPPPEEEEEY